MKFGENDHDKDQDRHAWRCFATGILTGCMLDEKQTRPLDLSFVAQVADAMLEEERKRR